MILLMFAHRGEAQEFIRRKHNIPVDFYFSGVYRSTDEILLITNGGLQQTREKMISICNYFGKNITKVINLGIAGSLTDRLQLNQIYAIRKIYHEPDQNDLYPSFVCADQKSKIDCVTVREPILDNKSANGFANIAQVVDQELWACAAVSKDYNLPLRAYKLISDRIGDDNSAAILKSRAATFSKHLFDFYKKLDLSNMNF